MTTPRFATVLLIAAAIMQGCTDSAIVGSDSQATEYYSSTKMRQSQLLTSKFVRRAGKVLERQEDEDPISDFVIGTSDLVLDMAKVLERYELLDGISITQSFSRVFDGFAVHVDDDLTIPSFLAIVENDPDIEWIEPDPKFQTEKAAKSKTVTNQKLVSSLSFVQGDQSSTRPGDGYGSVDVDVYIIDSGVDNPDLNVVERVDFTKVDDDDMTEVLDRTKVLEREEVGPGRAFDPFGHGTHVAGIVAAIDDSDGLAGLAPGARIHDFKVFHQSGNADMSSVISALDVIKARMLYRPRPMVVNLSLGADIGSTEYNALDEAVASTIAAGVTVVVAAGNDGIDVATVTPAHVSEAITVASAFPTNPSANSWQISTFSNHGPLVDIFAPGEKVMSLATSPNTIVAMTGTSMSAPLVTGAAALYLSNHPTASPQEVRDAILGAADSIVSTRPANMTDLQLNVGSF